MELEIKTMSNDHKIKRVDQIKFASEKNLLQTKKMDIKKQLTRQ